MLKLIKQIKNHRKMFLPDPLYGLQLVLRDNHSQNDHQNISHSHQKLSGGGEILSEPKTKTPPARGHGGAKFQDEGPPRMEK